MSDPPFVFDWHAHYPMQFDPEQRTMRSHLRRAARNHEKLVDRLKFMILEIADRFFNRESPTAGQAVTIDTMVEGNVGVAMSVAYCPFLEIDLSKSYGAPPDDEYIDTMVDLLHVVEKHVATDPRARIVRDMAALDAARAEGKVALVHAIEGGFHVGGTDHGVRRAVARLAEMGLGYVTVSHLFYRSVATNVPALPFLPDKVYRMLFPQDDAIGLDPLGKTLIRAMVEHGIIVDVTHMSELGMRQTFDLLDEIDPAKEVPVIATHIACALKIGGYEYNLKREFVEKIAARRGVCGILYCDHYMSDGAPKTTSLAESLERIDRHVEKLIAWGGADVLAIGSDLDGFIKPTLTGLASAANHRDVALHLAQRYPAIAEKICHGNALRVLRAAWGVKRPRT
jgi:microsomal dipeptidase-like Zn-dependent dipeptidase